MSPRPTSPLCGLLNLNKPIGVTSRDALNRVSRPLRKVKVGHAGTLDPLASGVLIVCVGPATRLIEYVQAMSKTYRATIRLGATSDTLDADGQVVETTPDPRVPGEAEVREALRTQVGTIQQVPPQFSALKVAGKRAYDLAREGQSVELAARPVVIDRVELRDYAWPRLEVEVDCGSGTYIRSIARDVGEALGCGGLIEVLIRTRIGPFGLADAIDPDRLDAASIPGFLRPAADAVSMLRKATIGQDEIRRIARGQSIVADAAIPPGEVALLGPDGGLVAVARSEGGRLSPTRVLIAENGGFS